jgi:hypothetical protein
MFRADRAFLSRSSSTRHVTQQRKLLLSNMNDLRRDEVELKNVSRWELDVVHLFSSTV